MDQKVEVVLVDENPRKYLEATMRICNETLREVRMEEDFEEK